MRPAPLGGREEAMTVDEELNVLETQLRRLKIEYEIFFSNPQKKPPSDIEWKVLTLLRKFSDGGRMSFTQRFRYNEIAQRYAVYSDLWRKKARIREEGYRRPQDALLSVQGVRLEEHEAKHKTYGLSHPSATGGNAGAPFTVHCTEPRAEGEQVEKLFVALTEAKKKTGEQVSGSLSSFKSFVEKKTSEIRKQHGCPKVESSIEVQDGKVKLRARAKQ